MGLWLNSCHNVSFFFLVSPVLVSNFSSFVVQYFIRIDLYPSVQLSSKARIETNFDSFLVSDVESSLNLAAFDAATASRSTGPWCSKSDCTCNGITVHRISWIFHAWHIIDLYMVYIISNIIECHLLFSRHQIFKIHLLLMSQISSWPGNLRRLQASSAKAYTTKDLYLGYSLVGPAGLFKHHHTFAVICSNLFDDVWWFVACHCCNFTAKYIGQEVTESWRPNLWVKSQGQLSWVGQVGPIHGSSTVFLGKSFTGQVGAIS